MAYSILADLAVLAHLAFVLFALAGGVLLLKWRRCAWLHLPAAAWAVLIEWAGWVCPLTPLENWLRRQSGEAGYESGFVAHYLLPLLYPAGLTRPLQIALGAVVLAVNLLVYAWVWRRRSGK